jgi:hypothetical protein
MLSPADAAAILPPMFQILTGLSFAAILVVRFLAAPILRPLWGKLVAFAVVLVALGNFLMSLATAKDSMSGGAEFFTYAGISFFAAGLLVTAGLIIAARSGAGVRP